ncbi:MAG: magnesium transporter CorA family protein [Elusimicrobiota bacterium]|jgi:magnesium transporter|nr:magnesium transporter CorA family protein [Elusimicrobiota bacterium]
MIKAIYSLTGEKVYTQYDSNEIINLLNTTKPKLIWIDIHLESHELSQNETHLLTEIFKFHEMSIEDCLFPQYFPKAEEFEDYIFGAIHGIQLKPNFLNEFEDSIYELNFFTGKGFLITVHIEDLFFLETLFEKTKSRPQVEFKHIERVLYNIFNKVVSSYEFTLEKIDDKVEDLEDEILEDPETENMEQILDLKKAVFAFRKISESQQVAYAYFTRARNNFISKEYLVYFRDTYLQCVRTSQSIVMRSQMVVSLLEVYMSNVTVRLTEAMKVLTIIATVLMPVLIISGYFGMNVEFPEYKVFGKVGAWFFAVGLMLAAIISLLIYFKKKKWF